MMSSRSGLMQVCFFCAGVGLFVGACGVESPDADQVGSAALQIAVVPTDVACVRVTATGNRAAVRNVDVVAGQSATLLLQQLPIGEVTFVGDAFGTACAAVVATDVPSWSSDPVKATVKKDPPVAVTLTMRRNGRANVAVDFNDGDQGPNCTDPSSWPAAWQTAEQALVDAINAARAAGTQCGGPVPAMTLSTILTQTARCHSMDMSVNGYFAYQDLAGRDPFQRMTAAGFVWSAASESLAKGFSTAGPVVTNLLSGPDCQNVSSAATNRIGVGYVANGDYWTIDMAGGSSP